VFFSFALLFLLFISSQSLHAQTDTLYGRVTDANGSGIPSVTITIYESGNSPYCPNSTITATTSSFGYYSAQIDYYCTALIVPSAKQYTFTPSALFIDFQINDYSNVNFVGEHQ
jgi:hypothetical protein